jgi:aspartyl-tRNA(Asn)/glutamyl-tRNA(Gln) amidotransferase subunit C
VPPRRVLDHERPARFREHLDSAPMIDRAQVLHVAKLARLALSDEEVERMARELSAVLDHIEKIGELELDGVAPTSHVIDVVNALRADEPRPSLSREVALAGAPEALEQGFGVPAIDRTEAERPDQNAGLGPAEVTR